MYFVQLPALEEIDQARADIEAAEALREAARKRMYYAVLALSWQVGEDTALRDQVISSLYWLAEDIPAQWLAEAFDLNVYQVIQIAGKSLLPLPCQRCGQPLTVSSRYQLREVRQKVKKSHRGDPGVEAEGFVCDACRAKEQRERERKWLAERAALEES